MKIYKTKNGQPYVKLANGRAKFIKRSKIKSIRKVSNKSIKKRSIRGKTMAKRKTYSRKKSTTSIFGQLNKPVMGALGVVAYESLISPMIPLDGVSKDILELVGGLYLSKKRGILGDTGKSLVTLNAYQLASGLIGNKLSGLIGSTTTSAYNYA